jgi:hypothetical protein
VNKEEITLTPALSHPPAEAKHWRAGQGRGGKADLSLRGANRHNAKRRWSPSESDDINNLKENITSKEIATLPAAVARNDVVGKYNQGRGKKEKERSESTTISHSERSEESRLADYQKFAMEYFEFLATLNKAEMKMVAEKYQRVGLRLNLLVKIKKTINSVLRGEIKRIEAKKPLPTEKQEKMAIGFTKYRIRIEEIEAEVHKVLCELGVQSASGGFALYKDFARESYRAMKRYYGKDQIKLNQSLNELVKRWKKEGLREDVLFKVKEKVVSTFGTMRMKGMV